MSRRERLQDDPTAIRNQPALWSPSRARWLIPAALLGAVAIIMLGMTLSLQIIVPSAAIILTIAFYLIMVACAIWMHDVHRRNIAFAWLMGAMAFFPVLALVLVTIGEARGLGQ